MAQAKKMLKRLKRYQEGGKVTDEFPEEAGVMPDQNPSEAAKQMLFYKKTAAPTPPTDIARLGKQAGLIGLGFAPGAGVADYFGKFPAVEGGTQPSAVENFQKGNYGTAALQGLGAMGDLAMAVPVAGAAIGSVMKAPRAAQRILSSSTTAKDDLTKLLGYSEDIPNEKWLAGKVEDAVEGGTNSFGVPRRMGSTTGYFGKPVEVPVDLLAKLPGERGEQSNVRKDSLDYIRKNWDKVSKEPPYIEVDPFGKAWVSEGNHRIMVAKEKGLKTLPVDIRYFSGGQRKAGELAPEKILEYNLPSTTTAKEDLANVPGVLPKAEREKNLTENFKDSKAVDKEGKPIRLYHGTNQDINEFTTQPGAIRKKFYAGELGSWFGDDPKIANKFAKGVSYEKENGTVYPVFLNIKNPKVFDSYEEFMSVMKSRKSAPTVRKELIKQGYDGIQVKDSTTDFGGRRDDWVAFFPEQVKSATGNKGTYDTTKPDITKAKGGEVRKPK